MTPVAIVSPAAAATQGAAPHGAAPPGGVFAALFAAIAAGSAAPQADPAGRPKEDSSANPLPLIQGTPSPPDPDGNEAPASEKDGDTPGATTPLFAPPLPVPATPPIASNPESTPLPPAPPSITAPMTPPTIAAPESASPEPPAALAAPVANAAKTTPPATRESASAIPPTFVPALPPAATAADKPAQLALPAQIAPQSKAAGTPAANATATNPGSSVVDDAAANTDLPQLQPTQQMKKPAAAAGEAKPVAAETKPPPAQAAAGGSNGTIFVTPTTADAAMPLPVTDASGQVKTVPLSNLANLPNGAAVTAIGAVIAGEAAAGTNRFLIRLDPPELGRIDVRLHFGRDGEVHARLIADRPETASLLMRDAAILERALNTAGMRTDSGVDVMLRDSSGGSTGNHGESAGDVPAAPAYRPSPATDSLPAAPPGWTRPAPAGRLDLTV